MRLRRLFHPTLVILIAGVLAGCGGPSEEDVLTPDKIRASESAPELPDVQLSENPEPPPAPPEPEQPVLNELDNGMVDNAVDPLAPAVAGAIPAAFQDRWGRVPADCRPADTIGGALVIGGDSLMSRESVGRARLLNKALRTRLSGVNMYIADLTGEAPTAEHWTNATLAAAAASDNIVLPSVAAVLDRVQQVHRAQLNVSGAPTNVPSAAASPEDVLPPANVSPSVA